MNRIGQIVGLLVSISACAKAREVDSGAPCPTWKAEIQPLFEDQCVSCHGSNRIEGSYDLGSYSTALGPGIDTVPNAIAGDQSSELLAVFARPETDLHASFKSHRDLIGDWIIRCELAYESPRIHEPGLMNPADPDFHGTLIAANNFDFASCANCHGHDFEGGTSRRSCKSCHSDGPTSCSTCHVRDVNSGLHRLHLEGGPLARRVACSTCHVVPDDYRDRGHLFGEMGEVQTGSVEVLVRFDRETSRCSVPECHGSREPSWLDDAKPSSCGSCHGSPPSDHASSKCKNCHPGVGDEGDGLLSTLLHLNGTVDLGRNGRDCDSCHQVANERGHRAHLDAPLGLSTPITCETCHIVPSDVESAGHIDSDVPAEVFPGAIAENSLAFAGGASQLWDAARGTCSNTHCHGTSTIAWRDNDTIACGSCHAIPPADATHQSTRTIFECAGCHASAIDSTGNVNESRHVNGRVEL